MGPALSAGLIVLCTAWAAVGSPLQGAWHYYHFKNPRPLTVNPEFVAIRGLSEVAQEPAEAGLRKLGMNARDVESWKMPGWSLARIPLPGAVETAVQDWVSTLAVAMPGTYVSPVFVAEDGGQIIPDQTILVQFKPEVSKEDAERILAESGAGTIRDRQWANMRGAYRLRAAGKDGMAVLNAANSLAQRPEVRFAEPDMIMTGRSATIPTDPGFASCWGLHNTGQSGGLVDFDMNAPQAWSRTAGSSDIIVVVIDVGVQQDHPDINQMPGVDLTGEGVEGGGPANACDKHGTPVAGCVSARINDLGTVGVAPGCLVASARAFISTLTCDGSWIGPPSWTVDALAWAESIGARITNNSNYYSSPSSAIETKYAETRAAGMLHFASAGNRGSSSLSYPASLPPVNAVTSMGRDGVRSSFSSYGTGLDFAAPGNQIYTTDRTGSVGYGPTDYVWMQGTSFASPYVAGIAALVLSANPALTADQVEEILQQSCRDLGPAGYDTGHGWGMPRAMHAVALAYGTVAPDLDDDTDVDLDDYAILQSCLTGAGQIPGAACFRADFDANQAVDAEDVTIFRNCFSGPGVSAGQSCMPP